MTSEPKPPPTCYTCGAELSRLPPGVTGWFCKPCRSRREATERLKRKQGNGGLCNGLDFKPASHSLAA